MHLPVPPLCRDRPPSEEYRLLGLRAVSRAVFPAVLLALAIPDACAESPKTVLVLVEGSSSLKNLAVGMGRQLGSLLGHFNTAVTVQGVNEYTPRQLYGYDFTFYIGFHINNAVPQRFTDDVLKLDRRVIWLATGFREFSQRPGVAEKLGFAVTRVDSSSKFDLVRYRGNTFTKKEPAVSIVELRPRSGASVLATVGEAGSRKDHPYIVQTGSLTYIADSPFAYADEASEYLLFADMLHDILGEPHEESHSALIRIEDVTPMEDPDRLRDIADILSARSIPFLVGVVPFYVNPSEGIRISLSDKPEIVDALKYMVQNGATIVMHGVTHQYRGVTATDYEFWDESTNGIIKGETSEGIARKLDAGIQEFMKNGLYPMVWETPHYTASFQLYQTVAKYFSTAMEQRLSIEDFDYSQFFPYLIRRDMFGQTIYPENLGYIPLDPDMNRSRGYVRNLLDEAKAGLYVRDGFASCFFHAFVDHDLLKELVDGIQALGYTFMDMREQTLWVKTKDRIILTGSQSYSLTLDDQYLVEAYYGRNGELIRRAASEQRLKGPVSRAVELEPGQFYRAEPAEFRERPLTFLDQVGRTVQSLYQKVSGAGETWRQAKPLIMWNYRARGAAYNDQASLAAVFGSVNIAVDTLFVGEPVTPERVSVLGHNLLIVPLTFVDSLGQDEYDVITKFVQDGGCLITDGKNDLAEELGIKFGDTRLKVSRVRDRFFPEERIVWRDPELVTKFEAGDVDQVFCVDEATEAPLVVGIKLGRGRILFFSSRFDPQSPLGTSQYPYLLDYVRRYFRLGPVIRRDNLDVFFDPGLRRNYSVESLVKQWVGEGVKVVHVAGWHEYPKYTYDYARLVSQAHANGILVYAWLEPPQVSPKFWADHPEWREKNYRGEDVGSGLIRPSWRTPMALTERKCLDAAIQKYRELLQQFDFDGVNLAELNFEAGQGLEEPQLYTPMHPSAREAFRHRYGFDPATVFNHESPNYWRTNFAARIALTEFRIAKLHDIYIQLLTMFTGIARERPGFQVIVTAYDSYGSPQLREYLGVDMGSIIGLQKQYGFHLSVEDPEPFWSTTPLRYAALGRQYAKLLGDSSRLMLDLNIGNFRKPEVITPFPTTIQTGTESFQMIRSAAAGSDRAVIYSEATINPQDLIFFPFAQAAAVSARPAADGYDVDAPWSFMLRLPREIVEVLIDDVPLAPSRENSYLVPAGRHHVVMSTDHQNLSAHELQPRIMNITGSLTSVAYDQRTIRFTYASGTRTLLSVNRSPEHVTVDGLPLAVTVMKGNDCYTVFLPPGGHAVELVAGDQFSYGVSWTSFWSTTVIAIFGTIAVALLLVMYLLVVVVRRRYRVPAAAAATSP